MKNLHKMSVNPLLSAIIAVSGSAAVSAAQYDVVATGFAINQSTVVLNVPGVPVAPAPPLYQAPRLGNFAAPGQGSGWPTRLEASINVATGDVVDFESRILTGGVFGSGGPQWDFRRPGRSYTPTAGFSSICAVSNDANDVDGILQVDCTATGPNLGEFAALDASGTICMTPQPSTLAPGANGCGAQWGGFPAGFSNPQVSVRAGQVVLVDDVYKGTPVSLTATNPPSYMSLDPSQNEDGVAVHEFQGVRAGGEFLFNHTGTLNGGDFVVTDAEYQHDTDIAFVVATNPPGVLGKATSFTRFDLDTVVSQDLVLFAEDAKNVPAMGAFGLAALFGGLVAVAARLRRRVS